MLQRRDVPPLPEGFVEVLFRRKTDEGRDFTDRTIRLKQEFFRIKTAEIIDGTRQGIEGRPADKTGDIGRVQVQRL